MTGREIAELVETEFTLTFDNGSNVFTCHHCEQVLTFPRLAYTHAILPALQSHLQIAHNIRGPLRSWEEA